MSQSFYVYLHKKPDGTVFYVGKGSRSRAWRKDNRNLHWQHVVAKHEYTVEILASDLSEDAAFILEVETIAIFRKQGHLVNMTDGGEGSSGYMMPEEVKRRLSHAHKASTKAANHRADLANRRRGKSMSRDAVERMCLTSRKKASSPEFREKLSDGVRAANLRPELSEKRSESLRLRWKDTAFREAMRIKTTGRKRPPRTKEWSEKIGSALRGVKRGAFTDEHKANMAKANARRKQVTVSGVKFQSIKEFALFVGRPYPTVAGWFQHNQMSKIEKAFSNAKK